VEGAIRGVRALGIRGLSVTVPHKVTVIPFLDEIDPVAKAIGAVNTVVNDDGRLKGYNTDWTGFVRSLEAHVPAAGRKIALLGAGGAARAIAFGLKEKGAKLTILNRTEELEMARSLAAEIGCPHGDLKQLDVIAGADVVVNATSVGMSPMLDKTVTDAANLRPEQTVIDIVYNPMETRFLREAKARGCRTIPGYEMLLLQGVTQFELWTGKTAPVDLMRSILQERLAGK
jgi:shikimate dehydrogenase